MAIITVAVGGSSRGFDMRVFFPSEVGLGFAYLGGMANAFSIRYAAPYVWNGVSETYDVRYGDIAGAAPPTTQPPVPSRGNVTSIAVSLADGTPIAAATGGSFSLALWLAGPASADFARIPADYLSRSDAITGGAAADYLFGGRGNDAVRGGGGDDTVLGQDGDDTLSGNEGSNTLEGGAGWDTADYGWATADLRIIVGTGADGRGPGSASGWGGADLLLTMERATGGSGNDLIEGTFLANILRGGAGRDTIFGRTLNDLLEGGQGDDELHGNQGADTLRGGEGDDQLWGRDAEGESGADMLSGGPGSDTARFDWASSGLLVVDLAAGRATLGGTTIALIDGDVEHARAGNGAAVLRGRDGEANSLASGRGNDSLFGLSGDDVLAGGEGFNLLDGGAGSDTATYANATGRVVVQLALGLANGPGLADTLVSIENVAGSAAGDTLFGDAGANTLAGLGGADVLWGLAGDDVLLGGEGNDTLYGGVGTNRFEGGAGANQMKIESVLDVVIVAGGSDEAFVAVDAWVSAEGLRASYLVDAARLLVGGAWRDVLAANEAFASTLRGEAGDDELWGRGFDDTLLGGAGRDMLRGQGGDDVLIGGAEDDQLAGGAGADRLVFAALGWGRDEVFGYAAAEGDVLDFRGSGLALADLIVQTDGMNTLLLAPDGSRIDLYGIVGLAGVTLLF